RREAERLISQGRVKVNGAVVTQLGATATLEDDAVEVDGARIARPETLEYHLLNKPVGVVTTVRDPQRRPTVLSLLRGVRARVYPVGRLDADSEGLLLLTNDGDLAHRLTHPRFGVEKEYTVDLAVPASRQQLDRIRQGIDSQGEQLRPRRIELEAGECSRVVVVLAEGKKREVRRMFEAVGKQVVRLRRVRFGSLRLGDLPPGQHRPLTKEEIEQLRAATSA
ncbi:MAG TPA: pseudouridine synthase, partial [Chloroflexota bacterium]|nr:pseudouridine synthase [Chloroflexota bacterium]